MRLFALGFIVPLAAATYTAPTGVDIRRITFDRQGFLWVSGERGTFRFDGRTYLPASRLGLPSMGNNHIAVTSDGTIWAQADSGLHILDRQRFRRISSTQILTPIEAAGNVLYTNPGPLQVWYRKGADWRSASGPLVAPNLFLHGEPDGRVWYGGRFEQGRPSTVSWIRFRDGAFERGEEILHREMLPQREVVAASRQTIFTGHTTGVFRFEGSQFASEYVSTLPVGARLLPGNSRQVWYEACGKWLSSDGRSAVLDHPVGVAADPSGGLWGALGERGLSYSAGPGFIESYSLPGLPDRPVVAVSRHNQRLYVARQDVTGVIETGSPFCDGTISREASLQPWGFVGEDAPFSGILADPDGSVWVIGKHQGVMKMSAEGKIVGVASTAASSVTTSSIRQLARSADGRIWVASKENLIEVIRQPKLVYSPVYPSVRYFSGFVTDPAGKLYAISDNSMPVYENGTWRDTPLPACLLSQKLRTVVFASETERWYGYRNRLGFTQAVEAGGTWSCRHFEERNGFPGDTQFLGLDRAGQLWRGSSAGLFVRRSGDRWVRLKVPNGEMHQLFHIDPDGSVFVAVGNRLLRIPPRAVNATPDSKPLVSYFESATGDLVLAPDAISFTLASGAVLKFANVIERDLAAPDPIEFRFDSGAWLTAADHQIRLEAAPRDASRLEYRYAGNPQFTGSLPLSVIIPWWRSYWTWTGLASFAGLLCVVSVKWIRRLLYHWRKREFLAKSAKRRRESSVPEIRHDIEPLLKGRYRVEGLIARGGFSEVFAALDETTGAHVVVKRLHTGTAPVEQLRRRFAQEIAAVNMIKHPCIVPILDSWIDEDHTPYLVMPRIAGPTLRHRPQTANVDRDEALSILGRIAECLSAAHASGVVHSDLKPENILLSSSGPMLIDFGTSAIMMSAGLNNYTRPAGTVQYMAPEQLLGRFSRATDCYSFALISFELLTGCRYVDVELPMGDHWESSFRRAGSALSLTDAELDLFVDALRFDPDRRAQDVLRWFERLSGSR